MKKTCYLSLCIIFAAICTSLKTTAQYHITSSSQTSYLDTICASPYIYIETNVYNASLSIVTHFGDGTQSTNTVTNGGSYGYVSIYHAYSAPGVYTIKSVLYNGTAAVDSTVGFFQYEYCNTFILKAFNDLNNNCVFDSGTETYAVFPMAVEVDSSGTPIDTLVTTSGFYYEVHGSAGTVYSFRVISISPGVAISCPASGIITDTVQPIVNNYTTKMFAINCTSATGFDLAENVSEIAGRHHSQINISVTNAYCTPENATLTMHFSTKYNFTSAYPTPLSVTGNTVVWSLTGVSAVNPANIVVDLDVPSTWLIPGDTVHTDFTVTPTAGDLNPSNNYCIRVDSVTGSWDPNAKAVTPEGYIRAGTKLTYTINFENTGNDTAFNIYVMDTLSDNLDPKSLAVVVASAAMNVSVFSDGIHNIAKFDFPHINLLDSTHVDQNSGMLIYSINAKAGLPNGTVINNEAGIYFDYNPVVMTNNVENIIGIPAGVAALGNVTRVEIYPNPVNDVLYVQLGNGSYNKLTVTNTMGQTLINQEGFGTITTINVKGLPAGVYYITLRGDSGVKVQKFEKL